MRTKSQFVKLIMFGCIFSIVPVIFVGVFSYIQSSNQVQKQSNHAELQFIKQVNSSIEQILVTVDHTLTNLLESNVVKDALYSPLQAEDFALYNNLRKEIIHLQSFDTKVNEVILLNNRQNWIIRNDGIQPLKSHPDYERYSTFLKLKNLSSWQLLKNSAYKELAEKKMSCGYTISLVTKLPLMRTEKYGLAFANISACSLAEEIYVDNELEEVMVIDEHRQIVLHRDKSRIGGYLSEYPMYDPKIAFDEQTGQIKLADAKGSYTMTYFKSSYNKWTYLSIVSIDQLTQESREIGWFTMLVSLIIIVLSVIAVAFTSQRLYLPVSKLVKSIQGNPSLQSAKPVSELQLIENYIHHLFSSKSKLENEMQHHTKQIRSLFLSRLFSGNMRPSEISQKLAQFELDEQIGRWRHMVVLTLQVDTLENTRYESSDLDLLLFAVSNILEEAIDGADRLPTVWFDRTLTVLRGFEQADPDEVQAQVYQMTESLKALIEQYLHLSVSIGISGLFQHITQTARAYEEGMEALKHRMILGKGVIVPFLSVHPGKSAMIQEYPLRIEHELIDAIKLADQDEAVKLLADWMRDAVNRLHSPADYQVTLMRLLNRLMILRQEAGISLEQLGIHTTSYYTELLSLHMNDAIEEWFRNVLVLPLIQVFGERRTSQYHSLSAKMIDLIQQHYEELLTLEDCAEKLHYNASYLSSVFKNETGYTFSEYLANYRLQVAKQWLTETELSVKEIAERLHYSNSHNFIRSFRKTEGMTPGQYRAKYTE